MMYLFESISTLVGLPSGLLAALCSIESGHNPSAIALSDGRDGRSSIGVCQIKYETAREVIPGIKPSDLFKPEINIKAAALYLKKKLTQYKNVSHAIAAYNAGSLKYNSGNIVNSSYIRKVEKEWRSRRLRTAIAKVRTQLYLAQLSPSAPLLTGH